MLWRYTWEDIIEYLSQIPTDRIIQVNPSDKKEKINQKYLEAICDKVETKTNDSEMVDFLTRLNRSKGVTT